MSPGLERARLARGCASLCLFFMLLPGASGRPKPSGPAVPGTSQEALRHEVTVTLKLIQVFVTDAAGKPTMDLERSDFILYDNGILQTITDFERHTLALPAAVAPGVAPAPTPGRAETPLLPRKFIFLIDYVRNGFEGVQKAKKAALEFLDSKVRPDDETALLTLSSTSGLTLHEYLTTDHGKVRTALRKLRDLVGGTAEFPSQELMGMELMNVQVFGPHGGHAGPSRRNLFTEVAEWAKVLRSIPGQKNIILFSQGFGTDVVHPGRLENVLFETMARELASANAPVFTVDTTPQVPPGRAPDATLPSGTLAEDSMTYLSRTTGGKFLGAVAYSSRIATDIQDATSHYYVLGYAIPAAWDGRYHDVKVEVRKPGYSVHGQRGYFNPLPFGKLSRVEKHLQLIEVALTEGTASRRSRNFPLTALQFAGVPMANTLLLSEISPDVRESVGERVESISLILGQNNAIVDGKRAELDWKDFRSGTVYQYSVASLAPGRYECRTVIRNLDDGRAAVGSCAVDVAAPPTGGPVIFPPFFLVRGPEGQYLSLASQGGGPGEAGLSISQIFPFPADEYVPLVGAVEEGTTSVFATLRALWGDEHRGKREMELVAQLAPEGREGETPIQISLLATASRDEADLYLLELELPDLPAGRYRIEITALDEQSRPIARTSGRLSVSAR